ncbi:MAG: dockerin type I repeat-containing protein, partial [Oscillospiraceae bacterium]|nr:dockerin type I repeat-containing protein [Oscillospiraceae bacterium]
YMSTVGCGIIYGKISDGTEPPTTKPTEPTTKPTTKPTNSDNTKVLYGDADCSGVVDILDVIVLNRNLLGSGELSEAGQKNADVDLDGKPSAADALNIMKYLVKLIGKLPVK